MRKFIKIIALTFIIMFNIVASGAQSSQQPILQGWNEQDEHAFELLNADRTTNGLSSLKLNAKLTVLAREYGQDMIRRAYFSHYNPEGQSPFDRMRVYGVKYCYAGENLAINISVEEAENAFMNSENHRANILNSNFTEVGIAVCLDNSGAVYVVQEFIGN